MGKNIFNKEKLRLYRALPITMIILGCMFILYWMPIWIWFVLVGILLVVVGLSL